MYKKLTYTELPKILKESILVDQFGLPRYWSTIYSIFFLNTLAEKTKSQKLRFIDTLYNYCENKFGYGSLDNALTYIKIDLITQICESYFIHLQNNTSDNNINVTETKWKASLDFLLNTLKMISKGNFDNDKINDLTNKFNKIERLYSFLRINKKKSLENIRSLPSELIEYLYYLLDPENQVNNPFKPLKTRWQTYIIFIMLLHLGLRRGELLSLPVNCIKFGYDNRLNDFRYWVNIENYHDDIDERYNKPSIKTITSYRQIPVSKSIVNLLEYYIREHRGKSDHPFLFTSQKGFPLSMEMTNRLFIKISKFIPNHLKEKLFNKNGKKNISPHNFRHTCAVVRLNQLLHSGDSMDEACAKLRLFFGWSRDSSMPHRYAKAVFEDRLSCIWNDRFDERTEIVRSIP